MCPSGQGRPQRLHVVVVVVAHIYPSVTGQRQTLSYWTSVKDLLFLFF